MSTPNDLQALLANIRPRPSPSSTPQAAPAQDNSQFSRGQPQPQEGQAFLRPQLQQHAYRHPSVSSAINSPSPVNTPPHRGSDILSPNVPTPSGDVYSQQPQQNLGRTADLLNLLKINKGTGNGISQPGSEQVRPPHPQESGAEGATTSHSRNISPSDLVASLLGGQGHPFPASGPAGSQYGYTESSRVGESASPAAPTAENTQDMLLRLLNRQKPGEIPNEEPRTSDAPSVAASFKPDALGANDPAKRTSEKSDTLPSHSRKPSPAPKDSMFTYVNPFEQLAAASPREKTPVSKPQSESPVVESMRNTKPGGVTEATVEQLSTAQEDLPHLAEEQRQAVSEVVGRLVDQIGREVDKVALRSAKEEIPPMAATQQGASKVVFPSTASPFPDASNDVKISPDIEEPHADVKAAAEGARNHVDQLADSWESAEDSAEKDEERVVPVYNFPLRPFISITVKPNSGKLPLLRDDGIMDISRLRKDFDQLDRSLTSATSDYIVYALAKNGGIRVIRQDDGSDKQVFRLARDRIFNVALCTSSSTGSVSEEQAVLGIGVSGTVYWAIISRPDKDLFELDALETESLILPPFPASDENTSGGQLKTRAKQSSRHPGVFAIGRGKNIYVVSPQAAMDSSYGVSASQRTVNTEKFFRERAMKISTGKAGKDFVFSDDDTVIASLDKTGRLRFWDIREVVSNPAFFTNGPNPAEIRVPLSTFVTGVPTEKSWPTSVLFIDKLRAYVKSLALRYVLVGLKQNHTLQLWDIGLGKAVQELKFPHENESDAICSVAYHAASGIIVVAHPTRNSIYFVHLSAPRYNLPPLSQASFIRRANERDGTLPKPDSTACMSGIREISFASKGQIRSFDLLPVSKAAGDKHGSEDDNNNLFELYVMHSKGVTCLNIKKEDLGWSSDNKITRPINALEEGFIDIADLQSYPANAADEPSVNGDSTSTATKLGTQDIGKKAPERGLEPTPTSGPSHTPSPAKQPSKKKSGEDEHAATSNGSEKAERKKKKKGAAAAESAVKVKETNTILTANEAPPTDSATAAASNEVGQDIPAESHKLRETLNTPPLQAAASMNRAPAEPTAPSTEALGKHMEALQNAVSAEFSKSLGRQFEGLYRRFDEERRTWDASAATKQDQVLRLVSSTLSDNVEKNLTRIISDSIQDQVLPTVTDATSAAVGKQLSTVITQQLGGTISRELRQRLPEAVSGAVQQPDVIKKMLDTVSQALASRVETEVSKTLHNTLMPSLKSMTQHAAEKIGSNMEQQMQAQMKHYEAQRHTDSAKIDQLTSLVHGLSDTVSSMAAAQTGFQKEVLRLNRVLASRQSEEDASSAQHQPSRSISAAASEPRPAGDAELAEIAQLMREGKYEEGSVKVSTPVRFGVAIVNVSFPLSGCNLASRPTCSTTFLCALIPRT